jgi:hypothetical protein
VLDWNDTPVRAKGAPRLSAIAADVPLRSAKPDDLAACRQNPVTGDDQRHRVSGHGLTDIARGFRPGAEFFRQRAIGCRMAPSDPPRRFIDALEKRVLRAEINLDPAEICLLALEIAFHGGDGLGHLRRGLRERPGKRRLLARTPAATRAAAIKGGADIPARSPSMLRPRCRTLRALSCSDPNKDLTGTVKTLANMVRFIIADGTDPKSIPHELAMIVPTTVVPVQPILLAGKREYAMFRDLRTYPWVLPTHRYKSQEQLIADLDLCLIRPAAEKAEELRKNRLRIISD